MATYVNIYDMMEHADFRKQVIVGCRIAATDILNEAPATANHADRLAWAHDVLGNGVTQQSMVAAVTGNATLQASAPNGPWPDGDIQFVINSLIDLQAASMAVAG